MNKAVFIDRDGVINQSNVVNRKPFAPTHLDDFLILPGVREALQKFKKADYKIVIVTNQPDLSTGKQTLYSLNEIHSYLKTQCDIDLIKVCGHINEDQCSCRKPKPGLIIDASIELDIDLTQSFMIGDRWSDIEAGQKAGCKNSFYIDYEYNEKKPSGIFTVVKSLKDCAGIVLNPF